MVSRRKYWVSVIVLLIICFLFIVKGFVDQAKIKSAKISQDELMRYYLESIKTINEYNRNINFLKMNNGADSATIDSIWSASEYIQLLSDYQHYKDSLDHKQ